MSAKNACSMTAVQRAIFVTAVGTNHAHYKHVLHCCTTTTAMAGFPLNKLQEQAVSWESVGLGQHSMESPASFVTDVCKQAMAGTDASPTAHPAP